MEFDSGGDRLYAEQIAPRAGAAADQTVVLLHPTPLNHRFWLPVTAALADYRLLLPDLRGHGRSPLGRASDGQEGEPALTVSQLAADLLALLKQAKVERAVFVGCSIGGYILYELWRIAPERIAGMVICNSKPQADNDAERAKREHWITTHARAAGQGSTGPTAEFLETMLSGLLSRRTRDRKPELIGEVRAMMEQVSPQAVQAIHRGLAARPDSRPTAASVTIPTAIIAGEDDASSTPGDLLALRELLAAQGAASAFHLIPHAGHYAPIEQPAATAAIVAEFCRSVFARRNLG